MISDFLLEDKFINYCNKQFSTDHYLFVENFLPQKTADEIYEWYSNKMNPDWWRQHTNRNTIFYTRPQEIEINALIAKQSINQDESKSYLFSQTTDHHNGCPCFECKTIKPIFSSAECLKFINLITNKSFSKANKVYCRKIGNGDFICSDNKIYHNAILQFSYCITKKWSLNWGGLKIILDSNDDINYPEVPSYNSLILKGHKELSKTNLVTPVGEKITEKQYEIFGFFE
jgi:hypothetical protein